MNENDYWINQVWRLGIRGHTGNSLLGMLLTQKTVGVAPSPPESPSTNVIFLARWSLIAEFKPPHPALPTPLSSCFSLKPLSSWKSENESVACLVMSDFLATPSSPGSSVHGVLQARILEWVANAFSRGSYQPRHRAQVSHMAGRLYLLSQQGWNIACVVVFHFFLSLSPD